MEKVFINTSKVSQRMYMAHTSHSPAFQYAVFNAFLKFDDGRKILLSSRKDKVRLIKLLKPVLTAAAVNLTDNTVSA